MNNYTHNYQDFPFAIECYDHIPHVKEFGDIPFWVDCARESGGPVLELGCGTGRIAIPVAREEIEITGLDVSPLMLDACRRKLNEEPSEVRRRVELVEGSMHQFDIDRKYALVFSAFRSFQILLSIEHQFSCLACVRKHLEPGGRLILDVFDPHLPFLIDERRTEEVDREGPFQIPGGRTAVVANRNPKVDLAAQILDCEMIYYISHPDGWEERLVQAFRLRYFFRYELEHLLARAGFEIEALYGDFEKNPLGTRRPGEIIAVARKT